MTAIHKRQGQSEMKQRRKAAINKAVHILLEHEGMITLENIRTIANTLLQEAEHLSRTQTKVLLAEMIEHGSK
jgi:hypothetical protein